MIPINYSIHLKRLLNFAFESPKKKNSEEDAIDCFHVKSNVNYYKLTSNGSLEQRRLNVFIFDSDCKFQEKVISYLFLRLDFNWK